MNQRTFTPDQLDELRVPRKSLHDEQVDSDRWTETRSCVFLAPDDGKTYEVSYQRPLTEYQECDRWFGDDEITATEVEQVPVTVMQWKPVTAPAEGAQR